ncbi:MAG TPA: acetyl-CoA C-acyltransferase, partial [Spirochaetota bacterium]|nr:acetyl-CoA C-acyltransferase [Spirochaetota bacterium]
MLKNNDPVIVGAVRTPLGAFNGTLKDTGATELGAIAIVEAIRRAGLHTTDIRELIMGIVLPCGYGQNPARQSSIQASLPMTTGCLTVNKVCGSGLMAAIIASEFIRSGYTDIAVAGGMENMNMAPYYMPKARWGARMGTAELRDHMINDGLWDVVNDFHMGTTNDIISRKWNVSREDQDLFAMDSYTKALRSIETGRFKDEIVPVPVRKKGAEIIFDTDECPRPTSMEKLAKMKPAFTDDGFATAGNSSVISDGASAVAVMSYGKARDMGITPLARIVAGGSAGIELEHVLMAPIKSIPLVCGKAGIDLKQIDLHEVNEAFAGSTVAVMRELDIDPEKLNVNGGSIALGHPIGASGARVLTTLLYEMKRRGAAL